VLIFSVLHAQCVRELIPHLLFLSSSSLSFSPSLQLQDGWLKVPTGKMSKKDSSSPKESAVRMWRLLPDEAVFRVIWAEEGRLLFVFLYFGVHVSLSEVHLSPPLLDELKRIE
jgi:hypothetical protein